MSKLIGLTIFIVLIDLFALFSIGYCISIGAPIGIIILVTVIIVAVLSVFNWGIFKSWKDK